MQIAMTRVVFRTSFAVRTANAFLTAFFSSDDIENSKPHNQKNGGDHQIIGCVHESSSLWRLCFASFLFLCGLLAGTKDQHGENKSDQEDDGKTDDGHPKCTETAAREERAEEKDEEGNRITNGKLQTDARR